MRLLILDRDGTLNRSRDDYVASADEWEPLPGALEAVARLNHGGWRVVLATNQSGIGRGMFDMASLNAIHAKMHRALAAVGGRVEAVFFCPHAPEDACTCRKPAPGLFEQIGERFGVALADAALADHAAAPRPFARCQGPTGQSRQWRWPASAQGWPRPCPPPRSAPRRAAS
jgi:D-glycero-D-manno-heptose 1,7-bisphosphate phosphatase